MGGEYVRYMYVYVRYMYVMGGKIYQSVCNSMDYQHIHLVNTEK